MDRSLTTASVECGLLPSVRRVSWAVASHVRGDEGACLLVVGDPLIRLGSTGKVMTCPYFLRESLPRSGRHWADGGLR